MAGEIFISYRRSDEAWARLLHALLQAEGVEAWYDAQVGAGQDWRKATARALEDSQIFVLLFTSNAAESNDIAKELAAATLEKKLIIPVRLEDIAPKGAFLYDTAGRRYIDFLAGAGAMYERGLDHQRAGDSGNRVGVADSHLARNVANPAVLGTGRSLASKLDHVAASPAAT